MIPRVFHRVWLGGPMPPQFVDFGESWLRHNPGWEMRLWGESDLDWLESRDLFDRAGELTPERYIRRFQSNLARYEILHRFGGVYVDADAEALAPLESVLPEGAFASEESRGWISNGVIGGVVGDPFWRKVIDAAPDRIRRYAGVRSPVSCGPHLVTRVAKRNPGLLEVLPTELFFPYHWSDLVDGRPPPILEGAVAHHVWNALRGSVSVIVPWRDDGSVERRRAWEWLAARLAERFPEWQVVPASDGLVGPFSRSRAVRNAIADTYGDVVVVHDADGWVPGLAEAVDLVRGGERWVVPCSKVHRLTAAATERVLAGAEPSAAMKTFEHPYSISRTGGAVVLSRETLLAVPPDPRFVGWGGEDQAWSAALAVLVGEPVRLKGPGFFLWHEPPERVSRAKGNDENQALLERYRGARCDAVAMTALLAEGDKECLTTMQASM